MTSKYKNMVLPWGSVCWPTTDLFRTRCPERPWLHCAYVRPRWGCACHCARWSYPSMVPLRGSAARGWHRPNVLDGPQCDFAAGWRDKMIPVKPAETFGLIHMCKSVTQTLLSLRWTHTYQRVQRSFVVWRWRSLSTIPWPDSRTGS